MKRRSFLGSGLVFCAGAGTASARAPFAIGAVPKPLLSPPFQDERGRILHLDNFSGRVILLNVWATWCPPCREEMPTLDALQARLGGHNFSVVPISIDRMGIEVARRFCSEIGIRNLPLYWGDDVRVQFAFGVFGLPTTLLVDRVGRERGRVVGPIRWDSDDAVAQITGIIAEN